MNFKKIRLELARSKETPNGDPHCGYELIAPLDGQGHLDEAAWRKHREACVVRRFWSGTDDEHGMLVHTRGRKWVFSYAPGEDDDEPVFKLERHTFKVGEYVSVTEHDGITRPFRVADIMPLDLAETAVGLR